MEDVGKKMGWEMEDKGRWEERRKLTEKETEGKSNVEKE